MTAPLTGRLLVAAPALRDPNFDRTVVLIVAHGDEGAVGVVLNRPSVATVSDILPTWDWLASAPPVVFLGGPVALTGVICLGRSPQSEVTAGWRPLFAGLGTVDLEVEPDDALTGIRVFAGHAGWTAAQLEGEIDEGAWFVLDALVDDAFDPAPEALWTKVLRRQGGALARVANFPADPAMN
ncbi:MAG: putative transcriptional regulator [Acidimicrobiaceae bacterium]|jgi:putative transcriptional regulator